MGGDFEPGSTLLFDHDFFFCSLVPAAASSFLEGERGEF